MKTFILLAVVFVAVTCEPPVPSNQYLPPTQPGYNYEEPSDYDIPNFGSKSQNNPSQNYGAPRSQPSQSYGPPQARKSTPIQARRPSIPAQILDTKYGPPQAGYNYARNANNANNDDQSEPANYQFEYMVKDDESGNDFGHKESRQGDLATGMYYVLLPDGRKQIVEYEADQDGYRPKISYEESSQGGYAKNGRQGNQNGGYSY